MLFSHSKSFTATAVGLLVDDGRLTLDRKVAGFFPEKLPRDADPRMRKMTVRDLLIMASGQDCDFIHDTCATPDGDWLKFFFSQPCTMEPGSKFVYNTTATYVLGAIVEKVSGEGLMGFLDRRLFSKLGIADAWSKTCPQGRACAGYGMNMSVRDLALFGELYLRKGLWKGERILSEEWVWEATAKQIGQGPHPMPDWGAGYGFQFWRCVPHGVYRADGALGQFTVVMPEQDAVLSFVGRAENTQRELELVWEHLLPAMGSATLPDDPSARAALSRKCAGLTLKPLAGLSSGSASALDRTFHLAKNERGIEWIRLEKAEDGWTFVWRNRIGTQRVRLGDGTWIDGSKVTIDDSKGAALRAVVGERQTAGSGGWTAKDAFRGRILFVDGVAYLDFVLRFSDANVAMNAHLALKDEYDFKLNGVMEK